MTELCKQCGHPLEGGRSNRKFCNKICAGEYAKRQWRERNPASPLGKLATGTIAEVNEMRVAIDLLSRGYEVYRAAFQGMPCDMYIMKGSKDIGQRIEVTTGNFTSNATLSHPTRDPSKYDVLAVVATTADGRATIVYKPEL